MKKWIYITLVTFVALMFLVSSAAICWYFLDARTQEDRYAALSQLKPPTDYTLPALPGGDVPPATQPERQLVWVQDPKTGAERGILPGFAQLYHLNSDIVGWLSIPAVGVDYPVMHTPDDPQYYLRRNFDKKKQTRGCLFLEGSADAFAPSDILTIYGHKMRDGTMFGQLDKLKKESFRQENPYIYLDTLEDHRVYEIFAVFQISASKMDGFSYHLYADCTNAEFEEYVRRVKELSIYDTGITPQYGDKLLTLSTCDKTLSNGRLVVVARQVVPARSVS